MRRRLMNKIVFTFVLLLASITAKADENGSCGENLNYRYDEANKTLIVSGNGAMYDYVLPSSWGNHTPWDSYKDQVEHIVIESGVTTIGNAAFYRFENLKTVEIPASVISIGSEAFHYCYDLTSLTIPQSIEIIGVHAFEGCSALTSIVVEEGNTNYDSRNHCNALIQTETNTLLWGCMNTTFPDGIESIGARAFYGCAIESAILPNSVQSIDNEAFRGCACLKAVTFGDCITSIGASVFEDCKELTTLLLPNSITFINGAAFKNCTKLKSVTLPNQITQIQAHLFYGCSNLKKIVIPKTVVDIYDMAFWGCSGLTSITCLNPVPPRCIGTNALDVDYTIPLYVPEGSSLKYKAADYWRNFVIIREISEGGSDGIWLTINNGAHGSMCVKIDTEQPYLTLRFPPEDGWYIYSVMLDEEDVTAELSEDGTYYTPAITANTRLTVVYANSSTEMVKVQSDTRLEVRPTTNGLSLGGIAAGDRISIYTTNGQCVYNAQATGSQAEIPLTLHQVYLVKVNTQSLKVCL